MTFGVKQNILMKHDAMKLWTVQNPLLNLHRRHFWFVGKLQHVGNSARYKLI